MGPPPPPDATPPSSDDIVPFSPMEQMEELDVVASYCGSGGNRGSGDGEHGTAAGGFSEGTSLEEALGIDFNDPNVVQRELIAK
jgi:hypothetical protein